MDEKKGASGTFRYRVPVAADASGERGAPGSSDYVETRLVEAPCWRGEPNDSESGFTGQQPGTAALTFDGSADIVWDFVGAVGTYADAESGEEATYRMVAETDSGLESTRRFLVVPVDLAPRWEGSPAQLACMAGGRVSADDPGATGLRAFDAATGEEIRWVVWADLGTGRMGVLNKERQPATAPGPDRVKICTDEVERPFYLEHTETGERWASAGVG